MKDEVFLIIGVIYMPRYIHPLENAIKSGSNESFSHINYVYDTTGMLIKTEEHMSLGIRTTNITYDEQNRVIQSIIDYNGKRRVETYEYNINNEISSVTATETSL